MVREFGLSRARGPVGYASAAPRYLAQIADLLRAAEHRATDLLIGHRAGLDRLAALLLEKETVDGEAVLQIAHDPDARLSGRADQLGSVEAAPDPR